MIHARLPVVNEGAVFSEEALGDRLRERRAIDTELVLLADTLIPATEKEAGIVDVVIEMMVGEEEVIDTGRADSRFHQLVRRGGAAIEHQIFVPRLHGEGRSPAVRSGCRCAGSEDKNLGHCIAWRASKGPPTPPCARRRPGSAGTPLDRS